MNKRPISIITIWLLIYSGFFGIFILEPEVEGDYIQIEYINIIGNDNFTTENGVVGGTGTPLDPYLIEGWKVDYRNGGGINIINTDAHFIIRNVHVSRCETGIRIINVTNCVIEVSNITSNSFGGGISIRESSNISLKNNTFYENNDEGCIISESNNILIESNSFNNNKQRNALFIKDSTTNVTVKNNKFYKNGSGMLVSHSSMIEIFDNECYYNEYGFKISNAFQMIIKNNKISFNNYYGLSIEDSSADVTNNEISYNEFYGIDLYSISPVTIKENVFTSTGINIQGYDLENYNIHIISPDNLVNGKPILYYVNQSDLRIDNREVGQLIIANCTDIVITNLTIEDTATALILAYVNDGIIGNNKFVNNTYGIKCIKSNYLTIANNTLLDHLELSFSLSRVDSCSIYGNTFKGYYQALVLSYSNKNKIFHNNFLGGFYRGGYDSYDDDNEWDDGYPNGGNYWGGGEDQKSGSKTPQSGPGPDGIRDEPIEVDYDTIDRYPLAYPWGGPSPPTNVTIKHGIGFMNITWGDPDFIGNFPITNYVIHTTGRYVSRNQQSSHRSESEIEIGNVNYYNNTDLKSFYGLTVFYQISAKNFLGKSRKSEEVGALAGILPSKPLEVNAVTKENYIMIGWSPPEDLGGLWFSILNYTIYRGISIDQLSFYQEVGDVLSFIDRDVIPGITYYYRISSVNLIGEGNLSEVVNGTLYSFPGEPINVTAVLNGSSVLLQWEEPFSDGGFPINNYYIYRSNGIEEILYNGNKDTFDFIDDNLTMGTRYSYRISAVNDLGEGVSSKSVSILSPEFQNKAVEVSINASKSGGYAPLQVLFYAGEIETESSVISYEWDFDDGGYSSDQNPSHTFQDPGEYNVRLMVIGDSGDHGLAVITIIVEQETPSAGAGKDGNQGESKSVLIIGEVIISILIFLIILVLINPNLIKRIFRIEERELDKSKDAFTDDKPPQGFRSPGERPQSPSRPQQPDRDYHFRPQHQTHEQPPKQYPPEPPQDE
jgi:parallel beta-helix repeat protein